MANDLKYTLSGGSTTPLLITKDVLSKLDNVVEPLCGCWKKGTPGIAFRDVEHSGFLASHRFGSTECRMQQSTAIWIRGQWTIPYETVEAQKNVITSWRQRRLIQREFSDMIAGPRAARRSHVSPAVCLFYVKQSWYIYSMIVRFTWKGKLLNEEMAQVPVFAD